MKKLTKTLAAAAATAASTALVATTVAIETAVAASFTGSSGGGTLPLLECSSPAVAEISAKPPEDETPGYETVCEFLDSWIYKSRVAPLEWSVMQGVPAIAPTNFARESQSEELRAVSSLVVEEEKRDVPEPSSAIALGMLGLGAVASRLRRRSK